VPASGKHAFMAVVPFGEASSHLRLPNHIGRTRARRL
jgi:hypothetical protein